MQVHLRLGVLKEPVVKIVDSYIFLPTKSFVAKVCPLPPFLKDTKCDCGNNADFVLDGIKCMCLACLNGQLKGATSMKVTKDISIPLTKRTVVRIKFEWSINGERWYTVYGRNIITKDWDALISKMKSMIVNNTFITFYAEYDREKRQLKI